MFQNGELDASLPPNPHVYEGGSSDATGENAHTLSKFFSLKVMEI